VWTSASFATVLEELLNAAGILDANIDLSGMSTEASTWLSHWTITNVCISEPEDISKLLEELVTVAVGILWWSPIDQKVKFKAIRPLSPFETAPDTLTDDGSFIKDSLSVERMEARRLTRVTAYYALSNPTAKRDDPVSYTRGYSVIDTDAEGANEYNEVRAKVVYSRFLTESSDAAAEEFVVRHLALHRNAPVLVKALVDPKETDLAVGGLADLYSADLVDFDGNAETVRALVIRRDENGETVTTEFISTFPDQRYFWIAPDAAPDYTSATDADKKYGYICADTGYMSDGTKGYLIV
jgi:hypothetical protein